jgi:L-ribulose-5-phosphate 3-epimerase
MAFRMPEQNRAKIDKSKRIMELGMELGTNIITTHIGIVPSDKNSRVYETMHNGV